jgi:hypothetical protein
MPLDHSLREKGLYPLDFGTELIRYSRIDLETS